MKSANDDKFLNEPSDIQTKIDIILKTLKLYEIDLAFAVGPDRYNELINKISKEEQNLQYYKGRYPEFFV